MIRVIESLREVRFAGEEIIGSLVPRLPNILRPSAELVLDIGLHDIADRHADPKWHSDFLPPHRDQRRIWSHIVKVVNERLTKLAGLRLDRDTQRIFVFFIGEASPGRSDFREDHSPFVLARNHVQTVSPFWELFAFDRDRIGKFDGGVLIRAGPPNLPIWNELPPDLTFVDERTAVVDRDIRDAHALRD